MFSRATAGPLIYVPDGVKDVIIRDCLFGAIGGGGSDESVGVLIGTGAYNITIEYNTVRGGACGFVYARQAKHPIIVRYNDVTDINRQSSSRGQMVQFDNVTTFGSPAQSQVFRNMSDKVIATVATNYEDHVNMFSSGGSAQYPILIAENRFRGGDSTSGSAIVVGDYGGSYIDIVANRIVTVANVGIGVAGGTNINITDNLIYQAGETINSKTQLCVYVMTYASNLPASVVTTGNSGIARTWLDPGDGATWGGYWWDGTGSNVTESGNSWGDPTLSGAIWDTPWPSS